MTGRGAFVVHTSDGKEDVAPHSEFVFVGQTDDGLLDIIDPLHVVSIRPGRKRKVQK